MLTDPPLLRLAPTVVHDVFSHVPFAARRLGAYSQRACPRRARLVHRPRLTAADSQTQNSGAIEDNANFVPLGEPSGEPSGAAAPRAPRRRRRWDVEEGEGEGESGEGAPAKGIPDGAEARVVREYVISVGLTRHGLNSCSAYSRVRDAMLGLD